MEVRFRLIKNSLNYTKILITYYLTQFMYISITINIILWFYSNLHAWIVDES